MSAIIAGEHCKVCGKPYWYSFGHPKWYDDVVKRKMLKSNAFKRFESIRRSGMCVRCFLGRAIAKGVNRD